ncbi:hypothetical protein SUDANB1_01669 [Streptomyces sp. enrichment culture]
MDTETGEPDVARDAPAKGGMTLLPGFAKAPARRRERT